MSDYFVFKSWGYTFSPEANWLVLTCDKDIINLYQWFSIRYGFNIVRGGKSGPHISIIKGHRPPLIKNWPSILNKKVNFKYSNIIRVNEEYAWVDVEPEPFNQIREAVGLRPYNSFHITLGRFKHMIEN